MAGNPAVANANRNRQEYERRIIRVVDYISQNLSEALTLEKLAGVAAFSPYHFHRVFKSFTGENLSDFVQRIRLEAAARSLLRAPQREITEIALDCGFASSSSFAHAFKNHFGMSASSWRDGGAANMREVRQQQYSNLNQSNGKTEQAGSEASVQNWSQEILMNVNVTTLPDFHVAYMRNVGPYGSTQIPPLWQRLMAWAQTRDLTTPETITLGISYDDPAVTPPEKCRYDACIVAPPDFAAESNINVKDIPGGKYAIHEYTGTAGDIIQAWSQMFSSWLPSSGYQPDSRACFELYRADCYVDQPKGVFKCDLCIPVKPL